MNSKWAIQVMLLEERTVGGTTITNASALDFIIEVVGTTSNNLFLPACTVNGPTSNTVPAGTPFSITVTGTDGDGGNLTIGHLGLPTGSTLTPPAGTSAAEPLVGTFAWTPTVADIGAYSVSLTFTDPGNRQVSCGFSITVPSAPTLSLTPLTGINLLGEPHALTATLEHGGAGLAGANISFDATAGPSTGHIGSDVTNGSGVATESYTSLVPGTDTIVATATFGPVPSLFSGDGKNLVKPEGGAWVPAVLNTHNSLHHGLITGTSWISCGQTTTDPTDPCAIGSPTAGKTTLFSNSFELPPGYSSPSISVGLYADNAAEVYLNGNLVGGHPCFGTNTTCPATNFNTLSTFSSSTASFFSTGTNNLEIRLWDQGGLAGLDYKADVSFTPPAPIVSNTVSKKWNAKPVADANGPYTVAEGETITLDGSGSFDLDGPADIVAWDWDLDNDGLFDDATGDSPIFSAVSIDGPILPFVQPIALRVTDSVGATDVSSSHVSVYNVAPELDITGDKTAYYVDWTAANPSAGTASGVITLPDGSTIGVAFEAVGDSFNSIPPTSIDGLGTDWWRHANVWPTTFESTEVPNRPPDSDVLSLIGGTGTTYVVTFSEPIVDPIMSILSLGNPFGTTTRYDFDSPFTIVSQGRGPWGGGASSLAQEPGDVLRGDEGNGTIKFLGTFSSFSWTVPVGENWHGFTFAARSSAALAETVIVDEGEVANNFGTWDDIPADRPDVALSASVGTVTKNSDGTWSWSFPTNDGPTQSQTVDITADDQDGGITVASFPLVVNNVAPTIVSTFQVAPIPEASVSTSGNLVAQATDPAGSHDPLVFTFDCDNNGSYETPANPGTSAADCVFDDNGTFTVGVQVDDRDGGITTGTVEAVVTNVAPTAFLPNAGPVAEGSAATLAFEAIFDPSPVDTAAGFGFSIACDGNPASLATTYASASSSPSADCTFGDNGTYPVVGRIFDKDNGFNDYIATVTVLNVDPTVVLDESGSISLHGGDAFIGRVGIDQTHDATATDPGSDDLTFTWNGVTGSPYFNNGTSPDLPLSPDGNFPYTVTDTGTVSFGSPGVFSVDVTVEDDDNGTASDSLTKVITGDCDCAKSKGFWKQQFDPKKIEKGKTHIEPATLEAYLDIVGFGSSYFTPGMTLADANLVFDPPKSNNGNGGSNNGNSNAPGSKAGTNDASTTGTKKKGKGGSKAGSGSGGGSASAVASVDESSSGSGTNLVKARNNAEQQILAAWLNFAKGAIEWNTELVDTNGDGIGDMNFEDLVHEVEMILLNPDATQAELNHAKDLAEAVNHHDKDNPDCETGSGSGSGTGSRSGSGTGSRG